MKKLAIAMMLLAGCASSKHDDPKAKTENDDGTITVCHETKAQEAVEACLPTEKQVRVLETIRSWPTKKDIYFPYDLERESFRKRYSLGADQISCLVNQTCGDEDEDAL